MKLANALFGQIGDKVGQVKDQFGQGKGHELLSDHHDQGTSGSDEVTKKTKAVLNHQIIS